MANRTDSFSLHTDLFALVPGVSVGTISEVRRDKIRGREFKLLNCCAANGNFPADLE